MKSEAGRWLEKQGRSSGRVVRLQGFWLGKEGATSSSFTEGKCWYKKNQYFLGPYLGQKNFSILMLARLGSGSQRDVIWLLEPESLLAHTAKMTQSFSGWGSPIPPPSHLLHFCLLLHLLGYTSLGTVLSLLSLQMTLFILSAQQSKFPLTLILCADWFNMYNSG